MKLVLTDDSNSIQIGFLYTVVIKRVEIIHDCQLSTPTKQGLGKMRADESGSSGQQHSLSLFTHVFVPHLSSASTFIWNLRNGNARKPGAGEPGNIAATYWVRLHDRVPRRRLLLGLTLRSELPSQIGSAMARLPQGVSGSKDRPGAPPETRRAERPPRARI